MIKAFKELKKVTWPTASELRRDSVVVIFTIIITAIFLGITDELVNLAFNWFIRL